MRHVIPFFAARFVRRADLASDRDMARHLARLLMDGASDAAAGVVVSDLPDILDTARSCGLEALAAGPAPFPDSRDGRLLPPGSCQALDVLARQGLIGDDEPVLCLDCCGPGMLEPVRREARERFPDGRHEGLVGLGRPKDHPVQVRAYPLLEPLGLACFVPAGPGGDSFPVGIREDATRRPRLVWVPGAATARLHLPRPLDPDRELLAFFTVSAAGRLAPLEPTDGGKTLAGETTLVLPLASDAAVCVVIHCALEPDQHRAPFCCIPVLFEGAPWTLGAPNHLYAAAICRNSATGRLVLGRQDFPDLCHGDRSLAMVTRTNAPRLDELWSQGRCAGLVCDREAPVSAAFLGLLCHPATPRQETVPVAARPVPTPLVPPLDPDGLRQAKGLLEPAMLAVDVATGETAAFVKGAFDYLCEMTLRDCDPDRIHLGV